MKLRKMHHGRKRRLRSDRLTAQGFRRPKIPMAYLEEFDRAVKAVINADHERNQLFLQALQKSKK